MYLKTNHIFSILSLLSVSFAVDVNVIAAASTVRTCVYNVSSRSTVCTGAAVATAPSPTAIAPVQPPPQPQSKQFHFYFYFSFFC